MEAETRITAALAHYPSLFHYALHRIWDEFSSDPEVAHIRADESLIRYINDPEITAAYDAIQPKWYA